MNSAKSDSGGAPGAEPMIAVALPGGALDGRWDASILCAGDIFPSGDGDIVEPSMSALVHSADLAMANLECPLTSSTETGEKAGPCLKASASRAAKLREAGFHLLSLANNHIMDYGARGLRDTAAACSASGLDTVGAGEDIAEAASPYRTELNGCRISVVALAEREFSIAGSCTPGAAELEPVTAWNAIRSAKEGADIVIAFVHGGSELCHFPSPRTAKWYRFLVDAGADAVVAHHPHVIQGFEIHKGAPILYSLGNFHFPGCRASDPTRDGMVARLCISGKRLSRLELHLIRQSGDGCIAGLAARDRVTAWSAFLAQLNAIIGDEKALEEMWGRYCEEIGKSSLFRLNLATGVIFDGRIRAMLSLIRSGRLESVLGWVALRLRGFMLSKSRRQDWRLLAQCYLECPAHLDKIQGALICEGERGRYGSAMSEMYRNLRWIEVPEKAAKP